MSWDKLPRTKQAIQAERFCEACHLIDDYHGELFKPRDFQKIIIRNMFGRVDEHGKNIVTKILLLLPRGGGKTYLTAVICLANLLLRGNNQCILCCAGAQTQSALVFDCMCKIIRQDPFL